ncbi:MAG: EAL domain-containing protein, partial [Thermosynechococcaceae cyanobacterium]
SINLSADQFYDSNLKRYIYSGLEKADLDPKFIELEISQKTLLEDLNFSKSIISEFNLLNIKTYTDGTTLEDFDFKKSSIHNLLSRLSVRGIKMHPSFIQNLTSESYVYEEFQSLLSMTRNLNMDVVVQGVETRYQLDLLRSLGCYIVQGNLFDPALPVEDITDVLKANWLGRSH